MEVHAHTHTSDPDSHRGRKKFTHYLWEFLMLFLAVFCGFLAENYREHLVEHQREKEFAHQLLADLLSDSVFFTKKVEKMNLLLIKHKAFYDLMTGGKKPTDKEIIAGCLPLLYLFDIEATTATYSQMKASGSLRYIKNEKLKNALQHYYEVNLPRVEKEAQYEYDYYQRFIGPFQLNHFRVQDYDYVLDTVKGTSPIVVDRTSNTDQELLNIVEGYAGSHRIIQERDILPIIKKLDELIDLLKKEYRLE
jgi:hypothetical protein